MDQGGPMLWQGLATKDVSCMSQGGMVYTACLSIQLVLQSYLILADAIVVQRHPECRQARL